MYILVHGGLHGGWCWEHVVPLLEAAGHKVLAPDLPGMGADKTPLSSVTLASTADFVADLIRRQQEPVVLVGHSMAGPTISEAAERVPDRLLGLVYVAANLVPGGLSMAEAAGAMLDGVMSGVIPSDDGLSTTYESAAAFHSFYNTTDRREAERAIERLTPQPIAAVSEPLTVTAERFGRVPRAYIECLQDNAIPIDFQRRMQADLPCDPVITMDCDHSPFLCAPRELAQHLIAIERQFGERQVRPNKASHTSKTE